MDAGNLIILLLPTIFLIGLSHAVDDIQAPLLVHRQKGLSARLYVGFPEPADVVENEWRFGSTNPLNKILELNCGGKVKKDYIKRMENRLKLHKGTSLEILNLQPEDQGLYDALVILQSKQQIYQKYNLQIHEHAPYPLIVWEGSSACFSLGIPRRIIGDIHWYKKKTDGKEVKIASQIDGNSKINYVRELIPQLEMNTRDCDLKINSLQLDNNGIYYAESFIKNENSEKIEFQLIVYESSTKNVTGREEESVQLHLLNIGEKFDKIEWKFGQCTPEMTIAVLGENGSVSNYSQKYEQRMNLNTADGTLHINKLQLSDSGAYEAIVRYNGTVKKNQIFLLTVKESIFYVNGTEGQSVHFPLNVKKGKFQKIEWTFGNRRPYQKIASFFPDHSVTNYTEHFFSRLRMNTEDSSLNIMDLHFEDSGFYECSIVFISGTESRKMFHLEVSGSSVSIIKIEGDSVRLSVGNMKGRFSEIDWRYGSTTPIKKIAGVRPGGIAVYYPDRSKRKWDLNTTDGSLQIDDIKMEDSGVYDVIIMMSSTVPLHKMFSLVVQGKRDHEKGPVTVVVLSIFLFVASLIAFVSLLFIFRNKNKNVTSKEQVPLQTQSVCSESAEEQVQ